MEDAGKTFKDNLRRIRRSRNLSQEDLAEMLDVSTQTIQNWESGRRFPKRPSVISSIAEVLKVSSDALLVSEGADTSEQSPQEMLEAFVGFFKDKDQGDSKSQENEALRARIAELERENQELKSVISEFNELVKSIPRRFFEAWPAAGNIAKAMALVLVTLDVKYFEQLTPDELSSVWPFLRSLSPQKKKSVK